MSQLKSVLLGPYNFLFCENGIFASSIGQRRQSNQGLYFRLPAVVFAMMGLPLLLVGELYAGNTPIQNPKDDLTTIQNHKDDLEKISKQEDELESELAHKLKTAKATQSDPNSSDSEIPPLHNQLSETLDSKLILLNELSSLAPDEPKHLYDLALTHLTKSKLTMLEPATTQEETKEKLSLSLSQKSQGFEIMQRIAPLDKPGFLDAHLFLAKTALNSKVSSAKEARANHRLANAHLDYALILDEENQTALGLKVLITQKTGQFEEARTYLNKLFLSDPFVYPQLCAANVKLGESAENVAVLMSAQQRLSDEVSHMAGSSDRRTKCATYLVDCLHRLEKLDAADKQVNNEMEEFSTDRAIQLWGKRLLAIGQELRFRAGIGRLNGELDTKNTPELVGYLREGYRLDPNNVRILDHIVGLARYDVPGIEKIANDIYQPDSKSPASVENILGTIALAKGDYLEAAKRFSRANLKAPNNAEYLNNLAYVYLTRPDPDPRVALTLVDKAIHSVRSGATARPALRLNGLDTDLDFTVPRETRYLSNFYDTKGRAFLALGKIAEEDGDQELANSRYSAAAANLLKALSSIDINRPLDSPLEREGQSKRGLEISQAILECYEASGVPKHAKVWRDRVKQLKASEAENQAD